MTYCDFGRPPFMPLSRAAAALASLVRPLLALPPLRPSATAAGFLRGTGIVLVALDRKFGETLRDLVHGLPVPVGDRDGAGFHEFAAAIFDGGLGVGHGQRIPKPLWVVNR
jgi:hypothetical protein